MDTNSGYAHSAVHPACRTWPRDVRDSAHASLGGTDELGKWDIEFGGDREQRHDSGVVCSALESANDIAVKPGAMRQRFLAHAQGLATVTNFFAQGFENVFGCH
jgi:hypothetical protein